MIDVWAASMGQALLQGSVAIVLVFLACRLVRALPPDARCWLWRLAYVKLLIALLWITPVSLPLLPAEGIEAGIGASEPAQKPLMAPASPFPVPVTSEGTSPVAPQRMPPLATIAFGLWVAGVAVCTVNLVAQHRRLRQMRRRATTVTDPEVRRLFEHLCTSLGVHRPPLLSTSGEINTPMLVGIRRPEILLPEWFVERGRPEEIRMALGHELAHHRRRDVRWGCLAIAARVLFFFHPLVWLADREGRMEQELACDELMLRTTPVSTADYGRLLLQVCTAARESRPALAPSVGITESYLALRRRIVALQTPQSVRRNAAAITSALGVVAVMGVIPWRAVALAPVTFLDFRRVGNQVLDDSMGRGDLVGNDLRSLPRGEQVLDGVRFHIGEKCVQLVGKTLANRPDFVRIPVGRRFKSLAVLHATAWGGAAESKPEHVPDGTLVGHYQIQYDDGTSATLPLVYGADIRDWWAPNRESEPPASAAALAWTGQNRATQEWGKLGVRLYVRTWRNPHPERNVTHVEFLSAGEVAAPFCVAATCGG